MSNTISFLEGFDEYGSISYLSKKWDSVSISSSTLENGRIAAPNSNVLSKSLKLVFTENCSKNFTGVDGDILVMYSGFALKVSALQPTNPAPFIEFINSGTVACGFAVKPDGSILAYYGSSTSNILTTSASGLISGGTWNYIEIIVDVASDRIKVFLNGTSIISATGLTNITESKLTTIKLKGNFDQDTYFDDMQVSTDASFTTTRISGDSRIMTFIPTVDAGINDFGNNLGVTSGNHYTQVDDSTPDDMTTFLSSSLSGSVETYEYDFSQLPSTAYIQSVGFNLYGKKSSADPGAKLVSYERINSVISENNYTPELLTTDFRYHISVNDVSGSWTRANLIAGTTSFGFSDSSS